MPLVPIKLNPGIATQPTPLLNEGGWSESRNIRWQYSLAQKTGGYVKFCQALPNAQSVQSLRPWTALSGKSYLGIAGFRRLDLFTSDQIFDITPPTILSLIPVSLSTTAGSATVVINDTINHPSIGDWFGVAAPVTVSNIVLFGSYGVVATGVGQYSITVPVNAASSVVSGGNVRQFSTVSGSTLVTIFLPNHGLSTGQIAYVPNPQPFGNANLQGYFVATVLDQDHYTINTRLPAATTATFSEWSGDMLITFFHPASGGLQQDITVPTSTTANWGEFLMWCPQGGPVYVWQPGLGTGIPAADVTTAPQSNTVIFVATQQQMLFCCGTVNLANGLFDPMLVRWSDVGDYTNFSPTASNQAGSFRLIVGSRIVGALPISGGNLIWTDLALYSTQYLQPPLIWGFQPIGTNCGLVGPHAAATMGSNIFWMSQKQFYYLAGGTPQVLPCTIWDQVFKSLDPANIVNAVCETNTYYNEVAWEVPQLDGTVVRARVQIDSGEWDYTILPSGADNPQTAWVDQSVFGAPLSGDASGNVWQHEIGNDAGFNPLLWNLKTGIIMISEGDEYTFVREVKPDFKFTTSGRPGPGVIEMLVYFYGDPTDSPNVKGPYPITAYTRSVPVRGRGRGVQFEFRGRDLGSWSRLGMIRYRGHPDGRR